jgi:hypothetical protein
MSKILSPDVCCLLSDMVAHDPARSAVTKSSSPRTAKSGRRFARVVDLANQKSNARVLYAKDDMV